jgi:hypothetical protein
MAKKITNQFDSWDGLKLGGSVGAANTPVVGSGQRAGSGSTLT